MTVEHEFGGQHTELKLSIVEKYLHAFTLALRDKFEELWYIDAFAGTGSRSVRIEARPGGLWDEPTPELIEQRRGSARIAIDVRPKFQRLVFIESKPSHCVALRELKAAYPQRDIEVVEGDANKAIQSQIRWDGWRTTRAVLFLDPYGMEVEWATLEAIASTKAIDVWFLFPLSGLYRQATRDINDVDVHKRAALTRMFGSDAWEKEIYSAPADHFELFSGVAHGSRKTRSADVVGLERYVKQKLETIFASVLAPLPLPIKKGPQLFSLFLCISNDHPKAIGLATRIGNHILKAGISS